MKALLLSSGGIRQITFLLGAFRNTELCHLICSCDHVMGTSAGSLMGFIIAATKDPKKLQKLETTVSHSPFSVSKLRILWDILTNKDIVRSDELRHLVMHGLAVVQPECRSTVRLHRDFSVGFVRHENGHQIYDELTFKAGVHDLKSIIPFVVGSASIIGVTSSNISDGGQMHVFPIRTYLKMKSMFEMTLFSRHTQRVKWTRPAMKRAWVLLEICASS